MARDIFYSQVNYNGFQGFLKFNWDDFKDFPNQIRENEATPQILHQGTFLGFLALSCKITTIDKVLGDYGFVHELAHHLSFGSKKMLIWDMTTREELATIAEGWLEQLQTLPVEVIQEMIDEDPINTKKMMNQQNCK